MPVVEERQQADDQSPQRELTTAMREYLRGKRTYEQLIAAQKRYEAKVGRSYAPVRRRLVASA